MPDSRPAIPLPLARRVKVEAGHRCAIPTCRNVPVELAHIDPWSRVQEHTFDNLVALCPTCHTRYDRGDIDRLSMLQYKANLSVLNGRYGELERRVVDLFARNLQINTIQLGGDSHIYLMYLIEDGLLREVQGGANVFIGDQPQSRTFVITEAGRHFVNQWLQARPLEPDPS